MSCIIRSDCSSSRRRPGRRPTANCLRRQRRAAHVLRPSGPTTAPWRDALKATGLPPALLASVAEADATRPVLRVRGVWGDQWLLEPRVPGPGRGSPRGAARGVEAPAQPVPARQALIRGPSRRLEQPSLGGEVRGRPDQIRGRCRVVRLQFPSDEGAREATRGN